MKRARLSNEVGKTLRGASRGFTLIEVLIALALFAIIAIVFAGGLSTASRAVLIADVRTRAESLARTQMESVKNQDYSYNSTTGQGTYAPIPALGYSIWSYNRTNGLVPSVIGVSWNSTTNLPTSQNTGLQKITLVIKHDDREVIRLEGYKLDR